MFTGLVETMGSVLRVDRGAGQARLTIRPGRKFGGIRLGESVAVNGVCLTVARHRGADLEFDAVAETLRLTNLGTLKAGSRVNLERALRLGDRLGGHFVTGHIQGVGRVRSFDRTGKEKILSVRVSSALVPALIPKGSVAIDGVSLTVGKTHSKFLTVYLIPHTLRETTLGALKPGDPVNLETDILIRALLFQKKIRA